MTYQTYCTIIKKVWHEELERMDEWIYSLQNNYDCSGDKYWILESPGQAIPSKEELEKIMSGLDNELHIILTGNDESSEYEEAYETIRFKW